MSAAFPEISVNVTSLDMTLRDWFKGQANAALIVALSTRHGEPGYSDEGMVMEAERLAEISADAMLASREQKEDVK